MTQAGQRKRRSNRLSRPLKPGGMRRAGRFTFKLALILGGVFFLFILGLSLITSFSLEGLVSVQQRLDQADSTLMWFRLLLIGALIGFWRPLNVWLAQRNAWSQARLSRVLQGRWMTLGCTAVCRTGPGPTAP